MLRLSLLGQRLEISQENSIAPQSWARDMKGRNRDLSIRDQYKAETFALKTEPRSRQGKG